MEILSLCGVAVTAAISAAALKKYSPETSIVIAIAGGSIIFLAVLSDISPFINQTYSFIDNAGINSDYGEILIKTVGVCAVCQFTSDCCRDSGQSSLASRIEFASKLTIVIMALPLFENILSVVSGLLHSSIG